MFGVSLNWDLLQSETLSCSECFVFSASSGIKSIKRQWTPCLPCTSTANVLWMRMDVEWCRIELCMDYVGGYACMYWMYMQADRGAHTHNHATVLTTYENKYAQYRYWDLLRCDCQACQRNFLCSSAYIPSSTLSLKAPAERSSRVCCRYLCDAKPECGKTLGTSDVPREPSAPSFRSIL